LTSFFPHISFLLSSSASSAHPNLHRLLLLCLLRFLRPFLLRFPLHVYVLFSCPSLVISLPLLPSHGHVSFVHLCFSCSTSISISMSISM
jgi:hypothetical protein